MRERDMVLDHAREVRALESRADNHAFPAAHTRHRESQARTQPLPAFECERARKQKFQAWVGGMHGKAGMLCIVTSIS